MAHDDDDRHKWELQVPGLEEGRRLVPPFTKAGVSPTMVNMDETLSASRLVKPDGTLAAEGAEAIE
ncbi:MAG TPA: hypothetical protein VJ837_04725, partial [Candidatus Paceibacterota bacterium]|nr:hypothetical protein [Candidatus Paceibacterota bacterium]